MPSQITNQTKDLAIKFSLELRSALYDLGLTAGIDCIIAANAMEKDPLICHSHDLLDANQCMIDAFVRVVGREPVASSDDDAALINAAWSDARKNDFYQDECSLCHRKDSMMPRHEGSPGCKSGSIASGGLNAHCACSACFD